MKSRDASRVFQGLRLVLQETMAMESSVVRSRAGRAVEHVVDVGGVFGGLDVSKLVSAVSGVSSEAVGALAGVAREDGVEGAGSVLGGGGERVRPHWEKRLPESAFNTFYYEDEMVGGRQGASTRREFSARRVPSSSASRAWGFGTTGLSVAFGAASSWLQGGGVWSEQSADALAAGLCRLRGAGTKLGQILSLQDESFLPPAAAAALERVRTHADVMPRAQLQKALESELGESVWDRFGGLWHMEGAEAADAEGGGSDGTEFVGFDLEPVAAASIGQVHRAKLPDGRLVAVKVQYPGVAESVESDLANLRRLLVLGDTGGALPKGLFLDSIVEVAKEELSAECEYEEEARHQEAYARELREALRGVELSGARPGTSVVAVGMQEAEQMEVAPHYVVPAVIPELSSRRVLTTEWVHGIPIDQCKSLPQEDRDELARRLLRLVLTELFSLGHAQTDPNFGNTLVHPETLTMGLIDFGATRTYPRAFLDEYLRLVWAAACRDEQALLEASLRIGFLTGHESDSLVRAHVAAGLVVGESFVSSDAFDFAASAITSRVSKHAAEFASGRLTPPPREVYSLHRKLSGAFLICIRLAAKIRCRHMLQQVVQDHVFTTPPLQGIPYPEAAALAREADESSVFWAAKRAALRGGKPELVGPGGEEERWDHLTSLLPTLHDGVTQIKGVHGIGVCGTPNQQWT